MSISLGTAGSGDYYEIPDYADLILPASDWCWGMWLKRGAANLELEGVLDNNDGSFRLYHDTFGSPGDRYMWQVIDDGGSSFGANTGDGSYADPHGWLLVILQRRDTDAEFQGWFAEYGTTPSKDITNTTTGFTSGTNPTVVTRIGNSANAALNPYYNGQFAELFKGDFSLSSEEIEALAKGANILSLGKSGMKLYLPFHSNPAVERDLIGSNDATKNGTVGSAEHAPVSGGFVPQYINAPVAAAAGGRIMSSLAYRGGLAGLGGIAGPGGGLAG